VCRFIVFFDNHDPRESLLAQLGGVQGLLASQLYDTDMHLLESAPKNPAIDFEYHEIVVRNAKGAKDPVVPLPKSLMTAL
jgi:hypothetical protein